MFKAFTQAIRPNVFWPPALILVGCVIASLIDFEGFLATANMANRFVLDHFDWLFTTSSFLAVILIFLVAISPLGAKRIGGENAVPILSRWNWFSITLCTTIAVGILFWGTAEPMFHYSSPPAFTKLVPQSAEAAQFALSATFLHWTITPYALYAVTTLAFALSFHNFNLPYSLSAPVSLLFGTTNDIKPGRIGAILDMLALFALVAGVAAALGAGVLTLTGGITAVSGVSTGLIATFLVTLAIVIMFIASSLTGLQRGIRILSDINVKLFIALALFIFIAGPTFAIIRLGIDGFAQYLSSFVPASLTLGERGTDPWVQDWTVYFFANWLAWAPITALFLGRIAIGYSVREFIMFNLILPAAFSVFWMSILGGAAIELDGKTGGTLVTALQDGGPEAVIYALFAAHPFVMIVSAIFLVTVFISFVTAMDSNTLSISNLCLKERTDNNSSPRFSNSIKIFWGLFIGGLSFIMTATTGIDGVRVLSNLGGIPGLIILILSGALLIRLMFAFPTIDQKTPGN